MNRLRDQVTCSGRAHRKLLQKAQQEKSRCTCAPADPCRSRCLNRATQYLCDDEICSIDSSSCKNRTFATDTEPCYEIFHTAQKGLGLRCTRRIEAETFIAEYYGKIITQEEGENLLSGKYAQHQVFATSTTLGELILDL